MYRAIFFLLFSLTFSLVQAQKTFTRALAGMEVVVLQEGQGIGEAELLAGATEAMIRETMPEGNFPIATNAFLVKTAGRNILIDTGYGWFVLDNLNIAGIEPEHIDAVILTHLHSDHIGGMFREHREAFPNAQVYISKAEYDYWTDPEQVAGAPEEQRDSFTKVARLVEAYRDRLHLFEPGPLNAGEIPELLPGITAYRAYGHTPGHTVFLLESDAQRLLVWGDVAQAMAIQVPYPQVVFYDIDPEEALKSRLEVLEYVTRHEIGIAGMHIPYPGMGVILKTDDGGYRFELDDL